MGILDILTEWTPDKIAGLASGIASAVVLIVAAVGKVINEQRRKCGHMKCCITGRPLKPKKTKGEKS